MESSNIIYTEKLFSPLLHRPMATRDPQYEIHTRQGERRASGNALFPHCLHCDLLAIAVVVVVVAHFDPHLDGLHLAIISVCNFGLS